MASCVYWLTLFMSFYMCLIPEQVMGAKKYFFQVHELYFVEKLLSQKEHLNVSKHISVSCCLCVCKYPRNCTMKTLFTQFYSFPISYSQRSAGKPSASQVQGLQLSTFADNQKIGVGQFLLLA